jgi:hypothetical protein
MNTCCDRIGAWARRAAASRVAARVAGLTLILALAAGGARAQAPAWFRVTELGGSLELAFEGFEETLSGLDGESRRFDRSTSVLPSLESRGYMILPRTLSWRLAGNYSFRDRDQGAAGAADDLSSRYHVRGFESEISLFSERRLSALLFAARNQTRNTAAFAPASRMLNEKRGLSLNLRSRVLPLRLAFSRNDTRGLEGFDYDNRMDLLQLNSHNFSGPSRTRLAYRHSWENKSALAEGYEHSTLDLNNTFELDRLGGIFLNSRYNHHATGTERGNSGHSLSSTASLPLPGTLEGAVAGSRSWTRFEGGSQNGHGLSGSADWSIYESLFGRESISRNRIGLTGGQNEGWGHSHVLGYRKRIPGGRLKLDGSLLYLHQHEIAARTALSVSDEELTVRFDLPVPLAETEVVTSSVILQTPGGLLLVEGDHYQLQVMGTITEVLFMPGPDLAEDDTILAQYRYRIEDDRRYDRATRRWSAGLEFGSRFNVVYSHQERRHAIIEGIPAARFLPEEDWSAAAGLNLFGLRHSYRYRESESRTSPSRHSSYTVSLRQHRIPLRVDLSGSFGISRNELLATGSRDGDRSDQLRLGITLRKRVNRNLSWTLAANWLDVKSGILDSRTLNLTFDSRYTLRSLQFLLRLGLEELDSNIVTSYGRKHVNLRIIRDF